MCGGLEESEAPRPTHDDLGRRLRYLQTSKGIKVCTPYTDVQAAQICENHRERMAADLAGKILRRGTLTHDQTVWLHVFATKSPQRPCPRPESPTKSTPQTPSTRPTRPNSITLRPLSQGYAALSQSLGSYVPPAPDDEEGNPFDQ